MRSSLVSGEIRPGAWTKHSSSAAAKIEASQRLDRGDWAAAGSSATVGGGADRVLRLAAVAVLDSVEHRGRRIAGLQWRFGVLLDHQGRAEHRCRYE